MTTCPPGTARLGATEGDRERGRSGEASRPPRIRPACLSRKHPESRAELAALSTQLAARLGTSDPGAYAAALRTRRGLAPAPGGGGSWRAVGRTPLIANDPAYPETFGGGFGELAGRISDLTYDARHGRLLAAVASGGLWSSRDLGRTWRSIGDHLPTQTLGSVAYTTAGARGGTIIALTGDNAFGGYTFAGVGAYRSTDGGRTWRKARGLPDGALGFKAVIDPTNPREVYAATGLGLFRSTDAGASYRNVKLPTGRCQGATRARSCFLANVVTDVAVQAPDRFGHRGGTVLAAVGWREGHKKNRAGVEQAPANGLYRSATGAPGSFQRLDVNANGFAPQVNVGRVELGAADGPQQNHGYLYAVVQDAVLFASGKTEGLDAPGVPDPLGLGANPTQTSTYLNGIYVSPDFGLTWKKMASRQQFESPTTGSSLAQLEALGFGPGIQAWYDEWIRPDPTRQSATGVPTRLTLGLEEVYENRLTNLPQDGLSDFRVIGAYNGNGGACLLVIASAACSAAQQAAPATTTHPDQHTGLFVPDGRGGATLVLGNDGGVYTQHVGRGQELSQPGFGIGAQRGFHTLLPYGVAVARDGIVYAGLQDNGEERIDKRGRQNAVFGGDGVFTVVDPRHSSTVYEETPEAGVNVSTDGGHSFRAIPPPVDNASFYAPLVMDPTDAKHLLSGGRQVAETTFGPETGAGGATGGGNDWARVYDLGTQKHPGDGSAVDADGYNPKQDPQNQISAEAVRGAGAYAAYCGGCDPVRDNDRFANGIATNVGGKAKPRKMSPDGWHIAPARGLPRRLITSVTIDPQRPRTVYVTLGSSSLRPYAPPGALGPDGLDARGGTVYESTNAGASFRDISRGLPRIGAQWTVLRGRQLVVANTVGVFASRRGVSSRRATDPGWGIVGRGLPPAPVFSMQLSPRDGKTLFIASLGRGIYRYRFTRPARAATCRDVVRPGSRITRAETRASRTRIVVRGSASDRGCRGSRRARTRSRSGRVARVFVAVGREVGPDSCRFLVRGGAAFGPPRSCRTPTYLLARGTRRWTLTVTGSFSPGRYRARAKALDGAGNIEPKLRRANFVRFRVR